MKGFRQMWKQWRRGASRLRKPSEQSNEDEDSNFLRGKRKVLTITGEAAHFLKNWK